MPSMKDTQQRLFGELNSLHNQANAEIQQLSGIITQVLKQAEEINTRIKKEEDEFYKANSWVSGWMSGSIEASDAKNKDAARRKTIREGLEKAVQWYAKEIQDLDKSIMLIAVKFQTVMTVLYFSYIANSLDSPKNQLTLLNQAYQQFKALFVAAQPVWDNLIKPNNVPGLYYGPSDGQKISLKKECNNFVSLAWDSPFVNLNIERERNNKPQRASLFDTFGKKTKKNNYQERLYAEETQLKEEEIQSKFKMSPLGKIVGLYYNFYDPDVESYIFKHFTVETIDTLFPNRQEVSLFLLPNVLNDKNLAFAPAPFDKLSMTDQILLAIIFDNKILLTSLLEDYLAQNTKESLVNLIRDNLLLGFAAANGRIESMKVLVKFGANLEQKFTLQCPSSSHFNYQPPGQWGHNNALFKHLEKYAGRMLELTPLALVIATAPVLSQEKAKEIIQFFLDEGANHNSKVSWGEARGYHTSQYIKTEKISLFDFDQTGLLSIIMNERRSHQGKKILAPLLEHRMAGKSSNTTQGSSSKIAVDLPVRIEGESEIEFLKRENDTLRKQFVEMCNRMDDLQQRVDALEFNSNAQHPRRFQKK